MKLFVEVELSSDEIPLATELFRTLRYVALPTLFLFSFIFFFPRFVVGSSFWCVSFRMVVGECSLVVGVQWYE